ncbi:MFS transporter [Bacillus chungangensis]|uniref:EmrB/QacA subfamily drug resistance transporter n=1 Tax=Bacillus chungangensis TaxID=587633 RepID=A0ABT9WWT8_9BACI|nr:MFS transporter [Bacillus chungangensis]MDQ0177589.1 EmrB/QacA subfamily drug resistance transporter [Bacillus chungangensis]
MGTTNNNQRAALTLFTVGVFMAALDNGIISAALTTINRSFGVSASWGAWGVTLYSLGLAVSVPIVGKLSDKFGRKKLFMIEIALFGIGSLLVAVSQTFSMFLISRLIQSLGGGGIFIIGSSHVLSTLPKEKQGRALGLLGGMNGVAAVLGPNIGSFLLDLTGNWHWLFLINIPIAIVLIFCGVIFIQETSNPNDGPLDFLGSLLLSFAILSVMYGMTNLSGAELIKSLLTLKVYGFLLLGIVFAMLFIFFEKRVEENGHDPILSYSLIRKKQFQWTLLIGMLSGAFIAAVIFIPSYVEQVLGISAEKSGYWMTPLALASGIGAGLGGVIVDKRGPIKALFLASIITMIGFFLFPFWVENLWQFIVASTIAGIGFGITLGAPISVLATEGAGANKGSALGTLSVVRQIGLTIAPTIYAGFITRSFQSAGEKMINHLKDAGININDIPLEYLNSLHENMDQAAIEEAITNIPDPTVQQTIMNTLHDIAYEGFSGLYLTVAIISCLFFFAVGILALIRTRNKEKML